MFLDVDNFKNINDSLGHDAGDRLLQAVAQRIVQMTRSSDTVARLGGDEFGVLLEGAGTAAEVQRVADALVESLGAPFLLDGREVRVTASVGVAFSAADTTAKALLSNADLAMYHAKAAGKNRHITFQPRMQTVLHERLRLEADIGRALDRKEFFLEYQPIVDLGTRVLLGVEALVRWRHPERGMVPPDQFIPLAEATGLIMPLGEWVLRRACADASLWPAHVKVAVNISAVQFRRGDLFDTIFHTLLDSGLAPGRLELEITETAVLDNQETHLATIRRLKNLGISMALDDFGTGYSAVKYLTIFPFDKIKIDKSFTQGVLDRRDCQAVIASTLALAQGLGIAITAEGIETEAQFDYMRKAGINLAQGYLFGRPVPLAQLDFSDAAPETAAEKVA
jgi:diguanylate cyclase (GGDEF)-like protein